MAFSAPKNEILVAGGFSAPRDEVLSDAEQQPTLRGQIGSLVGRAAFLGNPILGALGSKLGRAMAQDPRGTAAEALEFAPAVGAMGLPAAVSAGTAGLGTPAAIGLAGAGGAAGELVRQGGRRMLGLPSETQKKVPIPFTDINLPDVPGLSKNASNVVVEGATQAGFAGIAPAARLAGKVLAPAGKAMSRIGETFSGTKANDYKRLFNDPKAFLPKWMGGPKSIEDAGEAIGQATKEMRISPSVDPLPRANTALKNAVDKVLGDVPRNIPEAEQIAAIKQNVSRLTPQETYESYRDVSDLLKSTVEGKNEILKRTRAIWIEALKGRLGELSGEYSAASKDFSRAALRRTFSKVLPVTKYGQPSIGRLGFSSPVMGSLGYAAGGPIGAAAASLIGTSPAVHGAVTAGAGALTKLAQSSLAQPLASGFSAIIARAKERLNNQGKDLKPVQSGGNSEKVNGQGISDFVRKAKVGTKFTYQGKTFKVVPQPGRDKKDLAKMSDEERRLYASSKSRNRGVNTFTRS